jgi:hypothetical protein
MTAFITILPYIIFIYYMEKGGAPMEDEMGIGGSD